MAERGIEESRKLWSALLAKYPNTPSTLDYSETQKKEIKILLDKIDGHPTPIEDGMEIVSIADKTGRKLVFKDHQKPRVKELMVVAIDTDKLPKEIKEDPEKLRDHTEPFGPEVGPHSAHMMRLLMIPKGDNNYKAIAQAVQVDADLPKLGLRSSNVVNKFLKDMGWAATFHMKPVYEGSKKRYILTVEKPGQLPTQETWGVLSESFSHATSAYMVIGRVANVGRIRPAPVPTT